MIIDNRSERKILYDIIPDKFYSSYPVSPLPLFFRFSGKTWYIQSFAAILWSFMDRNKILGYQNVLFRRFWQP